jgi:hypothetical protein
MASGAANTQGKSEAIARRDAIPAVYHFGWGQRISRGVAPNSCADDSMRLANRRFVSVAAYLCQGGLRFGVHVAPRLRRGERGDCEEGSEVLGG